MPQLSSLALEKGSATETVDCDGRAAKPRVGAVTVRRKMIVQASNDREVDRGEC
jgi:hypothetical protein